MAGRTPPKFVPTLTEVVKSGAAAREDAGLSQEQLVQRVMQRVDIALERKLREAIASTVLEQTRALGPILREEIELVVRDAVSQAFADEFAAGQKTRK
jgi:ribosome-binding protein aMBF1 (putative translation factor)